MSIRKIGELTSRNIQLSNLLHHQDNGAKYRLDVKKVSDCSKKASR